MQYIVYALAPVSDPEDIRYVGQTTQTLRRRLIDHKDGKNGPYTFNWIKKVCSSGDDVTIIELERHQEFKPEREKYWIKKYRELGYRLTNLTEGGEGAPGGQRSRRKKPTPFMTATSEQRAEWMKTSSETKRRDRHKKNLKKVYLIDEKGNILKEFKNGYESAEEMKLNEKSIRTNCHRHVKGIDSTLFGFRFTHDPNIKFKTKEERQKSHKRTYKSLICADLQQNKIFKFKSRLEAATTLGIERTSVYNSLKDNRWVFDRWRFFPANTPLKTVENILTEKGK